MSLFLITALTIIVIILAAVCIHRSAQVSSLRKQVDFLEYSLQQFTEKEKGSKQDLEENESGIGFPHNL